MQRMVRFVLFSFDALADRPLSMMSWPTLHADAALRGPSGNRRGAREGRFLVGAKPQGYKKQMRHTTSAPGIGFGADMIIFYHVFGPWAHQF